jgi:hypothetical protein
MKFLPGIGFSQLSGSMGGVTASRNRYGPYVRIRSNPVNPNSPRQITFRTIVADLAARWNAALTAMQRTAWNEYAANVPIIDGLGRTIYLTGFNHFIRSNSIRLQAGLTYVDDAPAIFDLPSPDESFAIVATESDQKISVAFDNTEDYADEVGGALVVYTGAPQTASRNFFDGPWRYASLVAGAAIPPTSPEEMDAPHEIQTGQKVFAYARVIRADGRVSNPFRTNVLVTAGT